MPKILFLIPTDNELDEIKPALEGLDFVETRLCGFGLVEATANTDRWIRDLQPDEIMLGGLAGTYHPAKLKVGSIAFFRSVVQYGIGCFRDEFLLPASLGFQEANDQFISLETPGNLNTAGTLVSVTCSGLFSAQQVQTVYPDAIAEDMEGFGVGLAARKNGLPLKIVRAISNVVGEPFAEWQLEKAFAQLRSGLTSYFAEEA